MIIDFSNKDDYFWKVNFYNITLDDKKVNFPYVALMNRNSGLIVNYPAFERWLFDFSSTMPSQSAMKKHAYTLTDFLNYILKNTECKTLADISLTDIRNFIASYRIKANGENRDPSSWGRGVLSIYTFLGNYYRYNKNLKFNYCPSDFIETRVIHDYENNKKLVVNSSKNLGVRVPEKHNKKNRVLLPGYLDLFIEECKRYDPMLAFAVALQAYGGLREGEVVNVSRNSISTMYGGFGRITDVVVDLSDETSYAKNYVGKTDFGSIKRYREQKIYQDFIPAISDLRDYHDRLLCEYGLPTDKDSPLFWNRQGRPMTVSTYTAHVKDLFYEHFLPDLKRICESENLWATNAPYIEAYENAYPGAHMFRHWFTMYLITQTDLKAEEISKWRGDKNLLSMADYLHVYSNVVDCYKNSVFRFQKTMLEEIL